MKEVIDIDLSTALFPVEQIVNEKRLMLHDGRYSKSHWAFNLKIIQELEHEVWRFNTQINYAKIPYSKIGKGAWVELVNIQKVEKFYGCFSVKDRRFLPLSKDDFALSENNDFNEVDLDNGRFLETDIFCYSKEEYEMLKLGQRALTMDNRWFFFVEDNCLRWFRSWTATEIFRAKIEQEGDQFIIRKVWVNNLNKGSDAGVLVELHGLNRSFVERVKFVMLN